MSEEKARQSLENDSRRFSPFLGEPRKDGDGCAFPTRDLPFASFHVRYDIERKFLGRIYVMRVEGSLWEGKTFSTAGRIELRYLGFFRKGRPHFVFVPSKRAQDDEGAGMLTALNGDSSLIEQCRELEVEHLRIFFDGKAWKVQVRPYGGSYIKVLFPPLQYHVPLGKEQAERILSVMKRIAIVIAGKS